MHPDEIANLLRRALRQRVLSPGQALNQDDLAKRFGVSRIPLREALRTLGGEGLIVIRPGIGAVVTELSVDEVTELYDLRLLLEPPLVPAIIQQSRRHDVDELAELVRRMDVQVEAGDGDGWSNLNYAFHRRLSELSGRRHHARLVLQVLNLVEPYSRIYAHVLGSLPEAQRQHHAMVSALADGDGERLRNLMESTIRTTRERLIAEMRAVDDAQGDPLHMLLGPVASRSSPG
jgi:DNA-binding GntR family transcriptional regulator